MNTKPSGRKSRLSDVMDTPAPLPPRARSWQRPLAGVGLARARGRGRPRRRRDQPARDQRGGERVGSDVVTGRARVPEVDEEGRPGAHGAEGGEEVDRRPALARAERREAPLDLVARAAVHLRLPGNTTTAKRAPAAAA